MNIAETNIFNGQYWQRLEKQGIDRYLKLDNNLVIIIDILKKKRKKGGKVNQVYYVTQCGLTKHASFFSKLDKEDIIQIKRDLKLEELGL